MYSITGGVISTGHGAVRAAKEEDDQLNQYIHYKGVSGHWILVNISTGWIWVNMGNFDYI